MGIAGIVRQSHSCYDNYALTCIAFVGDSSFIAAGNYCGDIDFMHSTSEPFHDPYNCCDCHLYPLTLIQSFISGDCQLLLSSSFQDVKLWDVSSFLSDQVWDKHENIIHVFDGCKAARFSHSGNVLAALSAESAQREILLYDIETCQLESRLSDTSTTFTGWGHLYSPIHFSHSDSMLLWNGVLWDSRVSGPVYGFDQITYFGGGGFHPAGNEVIINSEVWDLRKFRLLCSVPSLDKTTITFNAHGDVIYAILRRNIEDVMSAFRKRRVKHPLFSAFRTVDAVNYSDIASNPVDDCVVDFTTESTDSFVGLATITKIDYYIEGGDEDGVEEGGDEDEVEDCDDAWSRVRIFEIGRRNDDDSDDTS